MYSKEYTKYLKRRSRSKAKFIKKLEIDCKNNSKIIEELHKNYTPANKLRLLFGLQPSKNDEKLHK